MQIIIAAIGKDSGSPAEALTQEYIKRLSWPVKLFINDGRKLKNKTEETAWLLNAASDSEIIYALDEKGKEFTSMEFANACKRHIDDGVNASHL